MGNESSRLSGLEILEKPILATDNWTLHNASFNHNSSITVFINHSVIKSKQDDFPLKQCAKHLMIYRHPFILKYVSSWTKNGKFYLATEQIQPLNQLINSLTTLQICIGLNNILQALLFLHEKAQCSHNNICISSIYVTPEGNWKLGGLEYLSKLSDQTLTKLQESRSKRYENAIAPEEDAGKAFNYQEYPQAVDQYAFGVLIDEILGKNAKEDEVPGFSDFVHISKMLLKCTDASNRPSLETLLIHPFFSHSFIKLYSFLSELPLKSDVEKEQFFSSLADNLKEFPEELVASQLGVMILARMVLLDSTAQKFFLSRILTPKTDENEGLFSPSVFQKYLVPRLLQMLCVRDAQIRLLLLFHFKNYLKMFSKEQLKNNVLPELVIGIKDTNNHLVAVTLRALADLVPLLGGETVIGGKRGKLFTDGKPKIRSPNKKTSNSSPPSILVESPSRTNESISPLVELPERPSPDGGEDKTTDSETEVWSDWDVAENQTVASNKKEDPNEELVEDGEHLSDKESSYSLLNNNTSLPDISELDVKHSPNNIVIKDESEIDFFQDMEPVISKTQIVHINQNPSTSASTSKFEMKIEETEPEGWGDDLEDWSELNDNNSKDTLQNS